MAPAPKWSDDLINEMLKRMREGETMTSIASDTRMPSIDTMNRWEAEQDTDLGAAITRARELGYQVRAEKIVDEVRTVDDPQHGRLVFDAERWFLGKMHPKKFGDASLVKLGNADGSNLDMAGLIATRRAKVAKGE